MEEQLLLDFAGLIIVVGKYCCLRLVYKQFEMDCLEFLRCFMEMRNAYM